MDQKFHSRAGSLVSFSNNGRTAQRNHPAAEFNNGVITSCQPLRDDCLFEVKIDRKVNSWSGSIEVGVTSQDPSNMTFPTSATGFREGTWVMSGTSVLKNGHSLIEDYGCDLDELAEGDRVGVLRTSGGSLHFFVNGEDQGVAASDVTGRVYAVIDMYGKCAQVTVMENRQNTAEPASNLPVAEPAPAVQGAEAAFTEYSNERLTFHERCGSLIKLSQNRRTAERRRPLDEFNNGIVMTNRPLRDDEMFQIRLDRLVDKWSGSIEVGVTVHNPATLKFPATMTNMRNGRGQDKLGTVMMSGCGILVNGKGTNRDYGQHNLDELTEGDRIGVMRKSSGALHYYINGVDQGVASARTAPVVWGVIDLYGMAVRVTIVDGSEPTPEPRGAEHVSSHVTRPPRARDRHEENHDDNQDVEKLLFHAACGQHTAIKNGGRSAYRPNAWEDFNNGVVLTQRLLRTNELFDVRIDKLVDKWAGSLEIGVTTHQPGEMDYPSTMTDIRSGTWMMTGNGIMHNGTTIVDRYGVNVDKLKTGDRVGVMRRDTGALHFYVNGQDQGEACRHIPGDVYGVVDLYGQAAQVTIMETGTGYADEADEVGVSSQPEVGGADELGVNDLCFHLNHGRNALLTNGARTAIRPSAREEFNDAVVMSNRPLKEGEMFEVVVEKLVDRWSGSIEAGVSLISPDELHGQFPSTMTDLDHDTWMLSGNGVMRDGSTVRNGYACDLDSLQVGSRMGMMVWSDGTLHYYVDGRDMGAAYQNIPNGVFAVIELYGQCCQVSVTSGSGARPSQPALATPLDNVPVVTADLAPPSNTSTTEQLHRFSQCCGKHVALTNNNCTARRLKSARGLVFSADPVKVDEVFQVRVDEVSEHWSGSLRVGLTTLTVSDSTPATVDIALNSTEFSKKSTWLVTGGRVRKNNVTVCDSYMPSLERLQVGDRVGVCRRGDGSMHVLVNGHDMGPAAFNIPKNTFALVDVHGKVLSITVTSSSTASQVAPHTALAPDLIQLSDPDEETLDADWLQLSTTHGKRVKLTNQQRAAERTSGYNHGLVFGARPLPPNQKFCFRLEDVDTSWSADCLSFGVYQSPPDGATLPESAMLLRHNTWLVSGASLYHNGLKVRSDLSGQLSAVGQGQVLAVSVDEAGNMALYLDADFIGVVATDVPQNCYPFVDLYGPYTKVTTVSHDDGVIVTSSPVQSEQREKADCTKDRTGPAPGQARTCDYQKLCSRFRHSLGLPDGYFVPDYQQCFCDACHRARGDDAYVKQGDPPKLYAVPFGWCQFNLRVPTKSGGVHDKWNVAYCGSQVGAIRRILDGGQLLMSDEVLGSAALTRPRASGRSKPEDDSASRRILLSPTVTYAAHDRHVTTAAFRDDLNRKKIYSARVAFQVLVKPGSYRIGPQTIGANEAIDSRFCNSELEWVTKERGATLLSSLLIRLD